MQEVRGIIERVRRINAHYQYIELTLETDVFAKIKPGEGLLARFEDADDRTQGWDPYLRELWYPTGFTKTGSLLIERPSSSHYRPQRLVTVLGPVGQPFRFRQSLQNVLLVAYGTSPLLLATMISQLVQNQRSVTLVLLGEARQYTTEHLPEQVEVLHGTDYPEWPDMLITLNWADQVFIAVGQEDEMTRFAMIYQSILNIRADLPKNFVFGVFQPLLPCGVGACGACALRVERELLTACTKGPAFDLTTVRLPR